MNNILGYLSKYYLIPPADACSSLSWIEDPRLQHIVATDASFKKGLWIYEARIGLMSFIEMREHLRQKIPHFSLDGMNEKFYDINTSTDIMWKLLLFQNDDNELKTRDFIEKLYSWLNKTSGKKNCFFIYGKKSAGKSYFASTLRGISLTVGQITNMNKNYSFPFNNCVNKRLLYWDEPFFESAAEENLKILFSGNLLSVAVKNQNNADIHRTPVLVTANENRLPTKEEFDCRINRYEWKTAEFLRDCTREMHPFAIYNMFDKFGLM